MKIICDKCNGLGYKKVNPPRQALPININTAKTDKREMQRLLQQSVPLKRECFGCGGHGFVERP